MGELPNLLVNLSLQKKQLIPHLEAFTYDQFTESLKEWLKSGRSVWYVGGNYGHDEAIELVESARAKLGLGAVQVEDLPDVRAIALESGTSFLIEEPLADEKNENSCSTVYYEVGVQGDDLKMKLTNAIIMQYIDVPFFDDLRTKQQLGYVVAARVRSSRDVVGNIFLVQSP